MISTIQQKKVGCRSFDGRLLTYCALAGGVLAAAQPAQAAIVYSGVKNLALTERGRVDVDLDGNGVTDFEFNNQLLFASQAGAFSAKLKADFVNPAPGNRIGFYEPYGSLSTYNLDLGPGAIVPHAGVSWLPTPENQEGQFLDGANIMNDDDTVHMLARGYFANRTGFLGLRFGINGAEHYGWLKYKGLGADNNTVTSATIVDWAYNDEPSAPIAMGQKAGIGSGSCFVTLTPGKISKLMSLISPVTGIIIRGDADAEFSKGTRIDWGTDSLKTVAKLRIGKKLMIALVRVRPLDLQGSDIFELSVGECSGSIKVSPF